MKEKGNQKECDLEVNQSMELQVKGKEKVSHGRGHLNLEKVSQWKGPLNLENIRK